MEKVLFIFRHKLPIFILIIHIKFREHPIMVIIEIWIVSKILG